MHGSGNVAAITGRLGVGDADPYRICLRDGATFSATTIGEALFDTKLFLFDATGRGAYGNDDGNGFFQSTLPAGTTLGPATHGTYHLAIATTTTRRWRLPRRLRLHATTALHQCGLRRRAPR